jgi:hypothetical protein
MLTNHLKAIDTLNYRLGIRSGFFEKHPNLNQFGGNFTVTP